MMPQPYDNSNVFAKILRGDLPCHRVFEDEIALAFMDVMPRVEGHVLVIPKRSVRTLLDIDAADLAALMPRVQRIGRAVVAAFDAAGLTLHQFSEEAGGQVVFHLHFHLLPRQPGVALRAPGGPMEQSDVLAQHAARIRAALD
jgi:histidine triad (HIT) family protein